MTSLITDLARTIAPARTTPVHGVSYAEELQRSEPLFGDLCGCGVHDMTERTDRVAVMGQVDFEVCLTCGRFAVCEVEVPL